MPNSMKSDTPSWRTEFLAVVVSAVLAATCAPSAHGENAKSLHKLAWDQCLDSAAVVPAARYAPYAYRSLAVQHPEVYLLADNLISSTLEDLPGSRLAYRTRDLRDVEMYLRLARRETKGGSFAWSLMTITPDSIFDSQSPSSAFDWLNLRAPSVAVLLKSFTPRLSTLESSLLRFSHLTRTSVFSDDIFIVVDRKGAGYLVGDTLLWLAGLSDRSVDDWADVSPVLVFNRKSVYSALTGRDDRTRDTLLESIMARLGSAANLSFGDEDASRYSRLKSSTMLKDSAAISFATLLASGLADRNQPVVDAAWSACTLSSSKTSTCVNLLLEETIFWANRLSPRTAELARSLDAADITESLPAVQDQYLSWTGRRTNPSDTIDLRTESWGCLWSYDLLQTTIDDIARTRAGSSSSQALAMSAALDLAGMEHFQLAVRMGDKQVPNQEWLFAGNGRFQFNFGVWTSVPDSVIQRARPVSLLVSGYSLRGASTRIGPGLFCSRTDALTIIAQLSHISRLVPHASLAVAAPTGEVTPIQRFLADLTAGHYLPVAVPWPRLTSD